MKPIRMTTSDWKKGLDSLRSEYTLIGPVAEHDKLEYMELRDDVYPTMDDSIPHSSAKSAVLPQSQVMFKFTLDEAQPDHHILRPVNLDPQPKVVIGIRPCDAGAFSIMKHNFNDPQYPDPYWLRAYEDTTFIGLACDTPKSTCFCTSVGGGPYNEDGLDVICSLEEDGFVAKAVTAKGEALINSAGWTEESAQDLFEAKKTRAEAQITSKLNATSLHKKNSTELFEASFWDTVAFACINCGTCTYSCPTCWCFDIQDEQKGTEGTRTRNWDSCQYPLFTLEGSGHNPRPQKTQRVRQRFMHKLKYYLDRYNEGVQCVGCGRCIQLCPVGIDIRSICDKMNTFQTTAVETTME